jgi:hypothetical protein
MANFVFGDCVNITCSHLGQTYRFYPKANESFNVDKGGIRGNDDMNQITSNGQMMSQLNRARWAVDGPIAVDQMSDAELSSLNLMAGSPSLGRWQFDMISGAIYVGTGRPVGDIATDSNAGTLTLKVSGGGFLQKI